ncbi:uncharacterized protein LOC103630130 precursor [Zea mays]|jgi:hypothetical protein|uniref:Uncharacterized protein n=2 Tax=Zea mays TaxID=4577 RepID=A0A804UBC8_MAIZE|nr:uncharacterized protein LOC103630130 precursor [Zea mays]|eukprot:XP_008649438.1 uncharacterized protein LOC103630130 [Zea mays]
MASAHKIVFVLLLLTASSSSMLQARTMAPSHDRQHAQTDHQAAAHAKERESLPSPSSQQLTRDTAPSTTPPPAPPASNTEVAVAVAKGGEAMAQSAADGSVPSPGIGHHKMLQ